MRSAALARILAFAAALEAGTGLVLLIDPAIVARLLLGLDGADVATLGRFFGIASLALGLSCWPSPTRAQSGSQAPLAMLTYNALTAFYLAGLATLGHFWGLLLWPGVALHVTLALLLVWAWRSEKRTKATQG
jgi:hypothetical protein